MAAKLQEIAERANVSLMTVSRVLRGVGRVAPETQARVRAIAAELGEGSSKSIAFASPIRRGLGDHAMRLLLPLLGQAVDSAVTNSLGQGVVAGIRKKLHETGGSLQLLNVASLGALREAINQKRYHGLVIRHAVPQAFLDEVRGRLPVVLAGPQDCQSGIDAVHTNESRAAAQVYETLTALGHQHIAWFGLNDLNSSQIHWLRATGEATDTDYRAAAAHGLRHAAWANIALSRPDQMPLLLLDRDWHSSTIAQVIERGVDELLSRPVRPTAIVVSTVDMARELLPVLQSRGLKVPTDMSVVAYGHAAAGDECTPKLTLVDLPMSMMGRVVPEMIQRRLANPDSAPLSLQIEARWHAGASVAPPSKPADDSKSNPVAEAAESNQLQRRAEGRVTEARQNL